MSNRKNLTSKSNIFIRADASVEIGSGHIMRCLTLADQLYENGAEVSFICRELQGNLCRLIEAKGYKVYRLPYKNNSIIDVEQHVPHADWLSVNWVIDAEEVKGILKKQNVDWLIVDHYAIDKQWEQELRPYIKKVMVIDDLADRQHDCDLLLDQNFYQNLDNRYEGLVPDNCKKLLGPRFALLRREFIEVRKNLREFNGEIKRILIFFGGSDQANETTKALKAFCLLNRPDISVDVIVGNANPYKQQIKMMCSVMPNVNFYCQVDNMAELMYNSDLAVGAGGITTWERCFLGLPTVTLVVAKNQVETTEAVADIGAIINLGWHSNVSIEELQSVLKYLFNNPAELQKIRKSGLELMNSVGCYELQVVKAIMEEYSEF